MIKMTRGELIDWMAERSGLSKKDSEKSLKAFLESIKEALRQNKRLTLIGFGTFEVKERKATTVRNPKTKEKVEVPSKLKAKLKFSESINEMLN